MLELFALIVAGLGVAVAIVAAFFAWRANHKSDDANKIARDALTIAQEDHAQRQRDRAARPRLSVTAQIVDYGPDEGGVTRLDGSGGMLRLEVEIRNDGDREAGRTKTEVTFPLIVSDTTVRWSDPSGRPLADHTERAARFGGANVITRTLDGVGRYVPETVFAVFMVDVPAHGAVNEYPINVRVAADGAELAECNLPLRIGPKIA